MATRKFKNTLCCGSFISLGWYCHTHLIDFLMKGYFERIRFLCICQLHVQVCKQKNCFVVYFWSYVCNLSLQFVFSCYQRFWILIFLITYFFLVQQKVKRYLNLLRFSNSCRRWGCLKTQVCRTKCMSL